MSGIGQPVLQHAITGQQHQSFAVMIEPPRRIHILHGYVIAQIRIATSELAEHAVWLVKKNGPWQVSG